MKYFIGLTIDKILKTTDLNQLFAVMQQHSNGLAYFARVKSEGEASALLKQQLLLRTAMIHNDTITEDLKMPYGEFFSQLSPYYSVSVNSGNELMSSNTNHSGIPMSFNYNHAIYRPIQTFWSCIASNGYGHCDNVTRAYEFLIDDTFIYPEIHTCLNSNFAAKNSLVKYSERYFTQFHMNIGIVLHQTPINDFYLDEEHSVLKENEVIPNEWNTLLNHGLFHRY